MVKYDSGDMPEPFKKAEIFLETQVNISYASLVVDH